MAQYEESASTVLSNINSSGVSSTVKGAIAGAIGSTGNVAVQVYEGAAVAAGTKIVQVTSATQLTQDPGAPIVLMDQNAQGANVVFSTTEDRIVVAGGNADNMTFQGGGNVTVETGGGNDTVTTGDGNDNVTMNGGGTQQYATSGGNNTVVLEGEGTRVVHFATGNDTVRLNSAAVEAYVDGGTGFDQVEINDSRANHSFTKTGGNQVQMHSDKPVTMDNVEIVQYNDGISVIANTHDKSIVAKLYQVAFGREADLPGMEFWMNFTEQNSLEHTVYSFINSNEFTAKLGGMSNEQFLNTMYANLAGRTADTDGFNFWMSQLEGGMDRADVAWAFAESAESTQVMGIDGNHYVIDAF